MTLREVRRERQRGRGRQRARDRLLGLPTLHIACIDVYLYTSMRNIHDINRVAQALSIAHVSPMHDLKT